MRSTTAVMMMIVLIVGLAASSEAKIEPKPLEAEQNFQLLKKTMETVSNGWIEEGSGDEDDDYYEDDDDYDDEEYDDFLEDEEGSGDDEDDHDDMLLPHRSSGLDQASLVPDSDDDIHFEEQESRHLGGGGGGNDVEDDLLYEYYNDELYGDDEDEDYQYDDEDDDDDEEEGLEDYGLVEETIIIDRPQQQPDLRSSLFEPSYIFLMLASALISFAVFILMFVLCRKSIAERRKKSQMGVPFIVSAHAAAARSTPIVKNYQRVPTSTKEFMTQTTQHTSLDMMSGGEATKKPLLT